MKVKNMISVYDARILTREGFGRQDVYDALSMVEDCIKNNASVGLSSATFLPKNKAEMYVKRYNLKHSHKLYIHRIEIDILNETCIRG